MSPLRAFMPTMWDSGLPEGGPRVEAQFVDVPSTGPLIPKLSDASADTKTRLIVHAYGFG